MPDEEIEIVIKTICPKCKGSRKDDKGQACKKCHGAGKIVGEQPVSELVRRVVEEFRKRGF